MTREEKQKAVDALKISAPVKAVTQEEFDDYIQTLNHVMDWLEQEPKYCDRNICTKNEYNGIGCDECEVTKSQEPVLDKIRAEIEALPKTYPFINHIDTYVKEDDVKRIIDKYRAESEE